MDSNDPYTKPCFAEYLYIRPCNERNGDELGWG